MPKNISKGTKAAAFGWLFVLFLSLPALGQTGHPVKNRPATTKPTPAKPPAAKPAVPRPAVAGPKVTLVNDEAFRKLLVPNTKPLMINFWATWCGPCREEFPDLVKLDAEFKGKIDFITVTLDFEEELNTGVPKFLADMKASMPTFLLVTPDEAAAIGAVSKEWAGALPFTVIYDTKGTLTFFHQGIIKPDAVRAELNKLMQPAQASSTAPR